MFSPVNCELSTLQTELKIIITCHLNLMNDLHRLNPGGKNSR